MTGPLPAAPSHAEHAPRTTPARPIATAHLPAARVTSARSARLVTARAVPAAAARLAAARVTSVWSARLVTARAVPAAAARLAAERGQASVELVAMFPLAMVIGLAAFTAVSAYAAHEQAGEAAEAAALAILQGGVDPREAAKRALSEAARRRATITVDGPRVRVRVRPRLAIPVAGLADRLAGDVRANAGPVAP